MTTLLDAARDLADIVLDQCSGFLSGPGFDAAQKARAIRTAIADAEKAEAEPVAYRYRPGPSWPWSLTDDGYLASTKRPAYQVEPLYTTPKPRKPLTNEQIDDAHKTEKLALLSLMYNNDTSAENFTWALRILARAVERAHGIGGGNE